MTQSQTQTRWLDEQERAAWVGLVSVLFTLPSVLDSELQRDDDLTLAGYMVLALLSEEDTRQKRMSELADAIGASPSRMTHIVARLEARGWVTRTASPEDRRVVLARLTEAGMDKVVAAAPAHVESVRRLVFDRLTEEQVAQLTAISRSLLEQA